ncbi:discoidin domain-containing protein [Pedobacter sp. L105]|uniref:discoidin domain-containing protein n=1 Tax=Pedobacter sp. L105 TaxID=1641871 RepID=UPI001C2090E3|nr:discoidin domain-containing protein [Pedobacter sp. L105]
MKTKLILLLTLLIAVTISCKKQEEKQPELSPSTLSMVNKARALAEPPATWQEHWFEHVQLLNKVFSDTSVAVYFDNDVSRTITWPNTYLAQVWNYTKQKYGSFGTDSRLFVILHTGRYGGGHPSTYMDASHDYRNVIDCGSNSTTAWLSGTGNDLDLTTHEVGHIVELASKNIQGSPAFNIWHDSKFMELYIYDVYQGLGRTADAQRWYNLVLGNSDTYPRANSHWFKDFWYPIYTQQGNPASINNYFTLLSLYFPTQTVSNGITNISKYSRDLNFGEFVHFWSGATGIDLTPLALTAFGNLDEQGNDWLAQLQQAKLTFPALVYSKDITSQGAVTVSNENSGGASATEGSSKLIDRLYNTKFFLAAFPTSFWAEVTFPGAMVSRKYTITSGNDSPDRDPKNWKLLGSNDGSNFVQLDLRSGETFAARNQTKIYTFNNSTAYKYYRLSITASNGSADLQLSEWRLLQ